MVKPIFLVVLFLITFSAFSKDYGVRGPVYDVAEENLLHLIHKKLYVAQKNGTLKKMQEIVKERAQQRIQRPSPVKGISRATKNRTWIYDPTWVLNDSIYNLKMELVAEKGQMVNPLNWVKLPETLLFIDADNKDEIAFTQQFLKNEKKPTRVVLVNGNIINLIESFNRAIYFDQNGLITRRFGIFHTPAIVKQQGKTLVINEVAL